MNNAAAKPAAVPPAAPRPVRMTLQSIAKGKRRAPYRLLVHGVDGVGKSTFGANAPSPVFLGTEDGTEHLDVARFPAPQSWEDVLDAIRTLAAEPSAYQTLVLDTLDWAEPLLWRFLCEREKAKSIEEVGGGYGKGYQAALDEWRVLLAALERLQRERGTHVILLAHSFIKPFKNPEGDDYDRYIIKLNEKAAALIREWCSGVYFANYETFAVKDKAKRVRGVSTGARLIYTQRTAAYDAKDRHELPESLPLSWAEFAAAAERGQAADPEALKAEISRKAKLLGGEMERETLASLERNANDASKLSQLNQWVNAKVGQKAEKETV
jgi:hypothetical protein